jgi:hypothetical protein
VEPLDPPEPDPPEPDPPELLDDAPPWPLSGVV